MRYHNILSCDQKNGVGIRVVLFVSGCSHHCEGCHNPVTHNPNDGFLFDDTAKEELFQALSDKWVAGITFSGGDPLFDSNVDEIEKLIDEIREQFPEKDIWIYSGYTYEELIDDVGNPKEQRGSVILKSNVFVDGRYEKLKSDIKAHWVGSSNQRVIDIPKSIQQTSATGKRSIYLLEN